MISVITGDIVQSQKADPKVWLQQLKKELNAVGKNPRTWEIFRGDSFQLEISNPLLALETAIKIKASIKSIRDIDVRMAIGIGEKTHKSNHITESNGPAFVRSGECFENLKKEKQILAVASEWELFNREMNLYLQLALIAMDSWLVNSAITVRLALEYPSKSQEELGKKLHIKQNAVSNRLKRANYTDILEVMAMYQFKLKTLLP